MSRTILIPSPEYDAYLADIKSKGESPELSNNEAVLSCACPVCGEACSSECWSTTLVGYFSEKGHDHDDNCRWFRFSCAKGHSFEVRVRNTCPSCDWKGRDICSGCGPNIRIFGEADSTSVDAEATTFVYYPQTTQSETITNLKGTSTADVGYFYAPYIPKHIFRQPCEVCGRPTDGCCTVKVENNNEIH